MRGRSRPTTGLVFLTGSHTLSMVWGLALLAMLAVVLIACHWQLVKERAMRLVGIAWLATLAGCINAWMLAPMIAYHARTIENEPDRITQEEYSELEDLFRVLRDMPDVDPVLHGDINAALPVLAIVWALVAGVAFWRWLAPRSQTPAIALAVILAGVVALIPSPSLLSELPEFLQYVQFPYRLLTYANFCVVGIVTLVLAATERRRGSAASVAAVTALAAIALFNLAISVGQNTEVRSWLGGRAEALASTPYPPPSWYAFLQFADGEAPIVQPTLAEPLTVPVTEEIRDSYQVEYPPGPAGTVQTNIATGSYLVDVSGATPGGP